MTAPLILLLVFAVGSVGVPSQIWVYPKHQELWGYNFIRGECGKPSRASLIDFKFERGLMVSGITRGCVVNTPNGVKLIGATSFIEHTNRGDIGGAQGEDQGAMSVASWHEGEGRRTIAGDGVPLRKRYTPARETLHARETRARP